MIMIDSPNSPHPASPCEYAAWILAPVAMVLVIEIHLLPALIAGLLVYELVHVLAPFFARHLPSTRAKGPSGWSSCWCSAQSVRQCSDSLPS
jgi:hypothetical protein